VSGDGADAASDSPDWWNVIGVADVVRELEDAGSAKEWNGTLARFIHTMLMVFLAQHPAHDSARDVMGEKLLRLIARGFAPRGHRARKIHRARLDAAICASCRTQAEAVALLMRLGVRTRDEAQGRRYRALTESEARSRVRAAIKYGGLRLAPAPRGGARKRKGSIAQKPPPSN
jgi:hypothetical protein